MDVDFPAGWRLVATIVLLTQLLLPLAVGVPQLFSKEGRARGFRFGRGARSGSGRSGATLPAAASALEPLVCGNCRGPVPLLAAEFPCPFCNGPVQPPTPYVLAFEARAEARRQLERAERLWRILRWLSARPALWLMRLGVVGWTVAVWAACIVAGTSGWPGMLVGLAGILGVVQIFIGLALVSVLGDARTTLPRLDRADFLRAAAEEGTCGSCGAPAHFDEGAWASLCGYCGGDNYRARLVQVAHAEAEAKGVAARASILAGVGALRDRRTEVVGAFALVAVAEAFYAVLFVIFTVVG